MNRRKWLWASLLTLPAAIVGGLVYANAQSRSYTCPITGEQLPCEKCCPLNEASYCCPVTGERLVVHGLAGLLDYYHRIGSRRQADNANNKKCVEAYWSGQMLPHAPHRTAGS